MENGQIKLIDVVEEMCTQKNIGLSPMRVAQDIMSADVKTLTLDHTVGQCLKFMENRKVRHIPLVDISYDGEKKANFVGVISQRDVLRLSEADSKDTGNQTVDKRAMRQLLAQIVARKPKFVLPATPIPHVIKTMTENHIDMVPVLENDDLVGIITTTDVIKLFFKLDKMIGQLCPEIKKGAQPVDIDSENSTTTGILRSWVLRTVQEIMTKEVVCLSPQDNLGRAIEVMRQGGFRHVPIKDENVKLVGLVSDRDVLRTLPFAGRRPLSLPKIFREHLFTTDSKTKSLQRSLENIMARKVLHILPSCSVNEASDILSSKKISCLPVLDEQEKLRGIVTVTDLMGALLGVYEASEKACLASH